jgi:hypothetical protein
MYFCWRTILISNHECSIWGAALTVIRNRVSEASSKQQLIQCYIWIGEQQDRHWRSHLYGWLRYIEREKKRRDSEDIENLAVRREVEKFNKK